MSKILGMIQSVTNQEFVRRIKSHEPGGMLEFNGNVFVQQCTNFERLRLSLTEQIDKPIEGPPRIDDILYKENVFALKICFRIIQQSHNTARFHRVAIRRCNEKVDLERTLDMTYEIAEKNKTSFEQTEHEQIAIRIRRRDIGTQLRNSRLNGCRVVHHTLHGAPVETRVALPFNRARAHTGTR